MNLFTFLFCLILRIESFYTSSILFWNNFQNPSLHAFSRSRLIRNDNLVPIFFELTPKSSPISSFVMNVEGFSTDYFTLSNNDKCYINNVLNQCPEYFYWGFTYIRTKGSDDCPLQSWGSCAIPYINSFACNCGGKNGCSVCQEQAYQPCDCLLLYGKVYDLLLMKKE